MAEAVRKYVSETTAHGPVHLTGERPVYIKILWLVAALISISYCSVKLFAAYQNYISGELTTTIKANSLDFELPDLYFCNEHSISGSYSVTLNDEDSQVLRKYRNLVNKSMSGVTAVGNTRTELYALRLSNTLPYQFLSDKLGYRIKQSVFESYYNAKPINFTTFHHPSYGNCFLFQEPLNAVADSTDPASHLYISFYLDNQIPPPFDNSTDKDMQHLFNVNIDLKPRSWDINLGVDFSRPTGLRMFLTPRGEYPSELDKPLDIGAGHKHIVKIQMQQISYSAEDLSDRCQGDAQSTADFVDPYSREKKSFRYSKSSCYYREAARLFIAKFNCSVWATPIPWELRTLSSCYNLTDAAVVHGKVLNNTVSQKISQEAYRICSSKVPCKRKVYSYQYSSSYWPSKDDWDTYYRGMVAENIKTPSDGASSFMPGLMYLLNNTFREVRESLLQIELSAAESKSEEIQLSLAYKFDSLIADIGGLLGLFIGISLLSVMELVELVHDCIIIGFHAAMTKTRHSDGIV